MDHLVLDGSSEDHLVEVVHQDHLEVWDHLVLDLQDPEWKCRFIRD
jgi:hypothetical protein